MDLTKHHVFGFPDEVHRIYPLNGGLVLGIIVCSSPSVIVVSYQGLH